MKKLIKIRNIEPGYSDQRLWPAYIAFSAVNLALFPKIGMGSSLFISFTLMIIGLSIATYISNRVIIVTYDHEAFRRDFELALENNTTIPSILKYKNVEKKKFTSLVKLPKKTKHANKLPQLKYSHQ